MIQCDKSAVNNKCKHDSTVTKVLDMVYFTLYNTNEIP